MSTMPIKYAVPTGSARSRLLTALAARYTGCAVSGRVVWDGLDIHPASQTSGRFCYSIGKTRIFLLPLLNHVEALLYCCPHGGVSACLQMGREEIGCRMEATFNLHGAKGDNGHLHSLHGQRICR